MAERRVSATVIVDAPASAIFDILADPAMHPVIDGSGTVRANRSGSGVRLRMGSKFGMDMKIGLGYRIANRVVEFEENRLIAWRHFAPHRWRWELCPLGENRTEVTETFDWSHATVGLFYPLMGFPKQNLRGIEQSLRRLQQHFSGS